MVRVPAGVHHRASCRNRAAECVRELLHRSEAVRRTQPPPARHDHVGVLDRPPAHLHDRGLDQLGERRVRLERNLHRSYLGDPTRLDGVERPASKQREPRLPGPSGVDPHGVRERRPLADELTRVDEVDEVPVQPGPEPCRQPGGDVRRQHRLREQNRVEPLFTQQRREYIHAGLRQRRFQPRVVGDEHRPGPELAAMLGERCDP